MNPRATPPPTLPRSAWLRLSWLIAPLALVASIVGLSVKRIYAAETHAWATQAIAQDILNLAAFPLLAGLAVVAVRGSLPAYLGWLGTLVYSIYAYAIYAFDVRFGPLFLVYVAIFGLSAYALIGGLAALRPDAVKAALAPHARTRLPGRVLFVVGVAFYLLWLSSDLSAAITDDIPAELVDTGLPTNPVHILDLALLLPAVVAAGWLLLKQRPLGYVLAPVLLTALTLLSVNIAIIGVVGSARGEATAWPVVAAMLGVAALMLVALRDALGSHAPAA